MTTTDRAAGFTPVQELMAEIRFGSYESSTEAARELDALIAAREAQAAAEAWREGYDEGVQRGIGLERTGHLLTRRHELGPIPQNPYRIGGESS